MEDVCKTCGISYSDFRTGMSYRDVFEQFWVIDSDPSRWKNKRRNTVLGRWREIKLTMWADHLEMCFPCKSPIEYLDYNEV